MLYNQVVEQVVNNHSLSQVKSTKNYSK